MRQAPAVLLATKLLGKVRSSFRPSGSAVIGLAALALPEITDQRPAQLGERCQSELRRESASAAEGCVVGAP